MNEIYVVDQYARGFSVVDSTGKPTNYYLAKTKDGQSFYCKPFPELIGDSLFFTLYINHEIAFDERLKKSSLCAVFDLKTKRFHQLPFSYFDITKEEDESYVNFNITRCYNENKKTFVYTFEDTEYLFEVNLPHTNVRKIRIKSRYMQTKELVKKTMSTLVLEDRMRKDLREGSYGPIYYDKQNRVYYRLVYPPVEVPKGVNVTDFFRHGGHTFSIMILDEEFNVLSEHLLPQNTYCPNPMFVDKGGLYLMESHFLNPGYDENVYPMRRFELVRKEID